MNALFFGTSDAPLYGVYHPPKARTGKRTGIVLCAPFGQEYMRSHRAFRQLALLLSKAGYHVFRFDYRGTGDSWGEGEDFTLAGAVADTLMAVEELRDTADVTDVTLVGLRLGGSVAMLAAREAEELTHLVLWDPIMDGAAYLADLEAADAAHAVHGGSPRASSAVASGAATLNVMGYPVSEALRTELRTLQVTGPFRHEGRTLLLLPDESAPAISLATLAGVDGAPAERVVEPVPGRWDEVDNWGSAMIPQNAIRALVDWIQTRAR